MEKKRPLLNSKYLFIGAILIATLLLTVLSYLVYKGDRMAARHAPLIHAAMEIKLNATLSHLWFEEILSGDRSEDIAEVWAYLDQTDWYAVAMLKGGRNDKGVFYPLTDERMRATTESVRISLAKYRQIARQRHQQAHSSHPGSDI